MKSLVIIFFCIFHFIFAHNDNIIKLQWQEFKQNHTKLYRSLYDESERYEIFKNNLKIIEQHNIRYQQGLETYELGITPFTDMTKEEFKQFLSFQSTPRKSIKEQPVYMFQAPNNVKIPNFIDWRQMGGVTRIKDQGSCGGCWAFSVIGAVEGAYFRKYGRLIPFSEQQLIDCAANGANLAGCDGGQLSPAFDYLIHHGLQPEYTYPFRMYNDQCHSNRSLMATRLRGYVEIQSGNENALTAAVAFAGPVSVAINADQIQFYRRGVFESSRCSHELNHAVLIVGYGSTQTCDYWIIKNSWGRYFGQNGYIFMRRGVNQCGIAIEPSYPLL